MSLTTPVWRTLRDVNEFTVLHVTLRNSILEVLDSKLDRKVGYSVYFSDFPQFHQVNVRG
jgi:hypothetical protein